MIRLEGITKAYGDYPALKGLDLSVRDGEFLALLGPSGSGKTTLLRIIAGLAFPDAGRVLFNGEDVTDLQVAERKVGFVFQHYALFKHMTIADNVGFGLSVRARRERPGRAAIRARAHELLDLVQLGGLGERYPAQLSGGQRQRVALARALAVEPQLLLLDEPFGALDAKVRKTLRRWLRELHKQMGLTSIFVTHDQEEALELADRVVVMDQGRIEQIGSAEQVYMEPASAFVADFVGETCVLPGGVHVRPHDIEIVSDVGHPVVVGNVFRKGGMWRVEGALAGHDRLVEFDLESRLVPPGLGQTVYIRPRRMKIFEATERNAP
ncbi:sulfate/molybdate ABC transporter ATP-binding protein [Novosphingobium sp. 1949]|uniref:Sulfate/molybdate ABC transporter ATP-binding protein n=1 Tax=Novosphingobium organovorum TaxID=2930092 RepID=A0ABT0BF02_9SPHN|nr:sulfate/molybdate ABC transporter ATP-binding protein [Novosphingobium organovorum]MCJ2183563.1 sulfate/molybdate ABC transporter ATP-binding protein [Novosphingobium organovorum]